MRYTFTRKAPKVSAAAAKDPSRPALTAAWYDVEAGELRATDSYIAVRMPVSPDPGDASGWVGVDALERSRKRDGGGISTAGDVAVYDTLGVKGERGQDEVVRLTVATFPRPDLGTAPNLPQLWPAERGSFRIGLNAAYLKRLADALGSDDGRVILTFQDDESGRPNPMRAIVVTTWDAAGERDDGCAGLSSPEGLCMPIRVS